MINTNNTCNVVIVGGCGLWTEQNHIPNLFDAKKQWPFLRVVGICDLTNPYNVSKWQRPNLSKLLLADNPQWLPAKSHLTASLDDLAALHKKTPLDFLIIACNPTAHFEYAKWALQNRISVICDKPLVVSANAASEPEAAVKIILDYKNLIKTYKLAKAAWPYLSFNLILRRRTLPAFNHITERLAYVMNNYNAGINHINILHHNGIYKYPKEMQGTGAHDFSMGVGSLSHSSYHYIDLLNQYLNVAKGDITYAKASLTSIYRVGDYLKSQAYSQLAGVNRHEVLHVASLPLSVEASELDFTIHLDFYNSKDQKIGDGNFVSNHLSFSPRTRNYQAGITEPAHFKNGGRISHLYIDIHQSGLQNLSIVKNNIAFQKANIVLQMRAHPKIGLPTNEIINFKNAYNQPEVKLSSVFVDIIGARINKISLQNNYAIDAQQDLRNVVMFSKFYQLIAYNYLQNNQNQLSNNLNCKIDLSDV